MTIIQRPHINLMVNLGLYLGGAKDSSIVIPSNEDLNNYKKEGKYYIGASGEKVKNTPASVSGFSLVVIKNASYTNGVTQLFIPSNVNEMYMRQYTNNPNQWLSWSKIVDTSKPEIKAITYSDNQSQDAGGGSYYTMESNGRIILNIGVVTTIGNDGKKVVAILPTNLRPQRIIYFPTYQNIDKCGTGYLDTDGTLNIQGQANTQVTAIAQISYFSR